MLSLIEVSLRLASLSLLELDMPLEDTQDEEESSFTYCDDLGSSSSFLQAPVLPGRRREVGKAICE